MEDKMLDTFNLTNTTKQKPRNSNGAFVEIKEGILGKKYELSVVFVGDKKAQTLNKKFRKKNYVPDILSFPLSETSGEIFMNLKQIKKEVRQSELSEKNYIKYIFIHGCLHLKGYKHGKKMDLREEKYKKKFCV